MEYVQALLFRIPSDKIAEASRPGGLLTEIDEHRHLLEQLPGFQDMRVIRSINTEGEIQFVVETRWLDDESLVEYETQEPNLTSIVNKYKDLIVPGSLQVTDMEAVRTQARPEPLYAASDRIALPLLVPIGVLAFALLLIYGLSRIYLEVPNAVATPLAAGIAVGILGIAWYLANNPSVPRWQIVSVAVAAVALLLGGTIFAAVHEDDGEGEASPPAASPTAPAPPGPGGAAVQIAMVPTVRFDQAQLTVAANQDVTILADNRDTGQLHNFAVYAGSATGELLGGTDICAGPCQASVILSLQPGQYFFQCDVHPTQMTGTLIAQ